MKRCNYKRIGLSCSAVVNSLRNSLTMWCYGPRSCHTQVVKNNAGRARFGGSDSGVADISGFLGGYAVSTAVSKSQYVSHSRTSSLEEKTSSS